MTTGAENRNSFERHLLLDQWPNFKIISQKCSLGVPLLKLLKWFRSTEQNGCQSKKRKTFKQHLLASFQNNFTEMFLRWPSTKIMKMVLLHWTKWPPKLKLKEKKKKTFITKTCLFKYIENFTTKKWKFSDKNFWYFWYFCSKHRFWVLVRTASARQF